MALAYQWTINAMDAKIHDEGHDNVIYTIQDGEEMQGVDYGRITPLLVKAIQELEAKIKILENK